jgi:hypothetical protein
MGTLFVDKLDPQSGTSLEIGSSGDTITIPSGATITNNGTQTGFGGDNTPFFRAYLSSNQSIANGTRTLITFNAESFDASSAYNTSNGRFTPQTAGYYFISAQLKTDTATNFEGVKLYIRKNGTELAETSAFNDGYNSTFSSLLVQMNGSSDYIDIAGNQNSGGAIDLDGGSDGKKNFFQAFKIIT